VNEAILKLSDRAIEFLLAVIPTDGEENPVRAWLRRALQTEMQMRSQDAALREKSAKKKDISFSDLAQPEALEGLLFLISAVIELNRGAACRRFRGENGGAEEVVEGINFLSIIVSEIQQTMRRPALRAPKFFGRKK